MIKTAIVTGATGEIGRAITEALIKKDFAVCAVYNTAEQKAEELAEKYSIVPSNISYYLYKVNDKLISHLGRLPKGKNKIKILAETPYGVRSGYIEKIIEESLKIKRFKEKIFCKQVQRA